MIMGGSFLVYELQADDPDEPSPPAVKPPTSTWKEIESNLYYIGKPQVSLGPALRWSFREPICQIASYIAGKGRSTVSACCWLQGHSQRKHLEAASGHNIT